MAKMTKRNGPGHSVSKGVQGIPPMKGETQANYDGRARKAWAKCKRTKDAQGNTKCKGKFNEATRMNYIQNMSGKDDFSKGFAKKGTEKS